jgi:hypothetical protein
MLIVYSLVAILSAMVSLIALWPSVGPVSLLAAPFVASAATMIAAVILASLEQSELPSEQAQCNTEEAQPLGDDRSQREDDHEVV